VITILAANWQAADEAELDVVHAYLVEGRLTNCVNCEHLRTSARG
jgi:hypothetical protein